MSLYILHTRTQRCQCGATNTINHLYEAQAVDSQGKASRLTPARVLEPGAAIRHFKLVPETILVCDECIADRPQLTAEQWSEWERTLERKSREARHAALRAATKPEKVHNIEDLA